MENKSKNSKIIYIYIVLLYLLVFQNFLQTYIKVFQYLDELLSVLGLITVLYDFIEKKGKINKGRLIILICLIIISILGFYSNLKYNYQNMEYAIVDWLVFIKFFFVCFLSQTITQRFNLVTKSKIIYKNIKLIVLILLILTIINYIFKVYPSEIRYGIMANKLFYEHPTYLAATCIALLVNIIIFSNKINNAFSYICILLLITTLRTKAIASAFVVICIIIYVNIRKKKISFYQLGILGIIAIVVALPQIEYYFSDETDSARQALMVTSIKIADDYFPLGTGFGTFGSFASGQNYSGVYELYGIENVYGIRQENAAFIADNFWPMILGQFGYLGFVLYAICLLILFIDIQKRFSIENRNLYIAKISCLAYLLISSVAESAFVNSIAIPLALIIGMEVEGRKKKTINKIS